MPIYQTNTVSIAGSTQGTLALSTTGAETVALPEGSYDVFCSDDFYLKVHGTTASDVTTSTGYFIKGGSVFKDVFIPKDHKMGGILASGNATLQYHRVQSSDAVKRTNYGIRLDGVDDTIKTSLTPALAGKRLRMRSRAKGLAHNDVIISHGASSNTTGGWMIEANGDINKKMSSGAFAIATTGGVFFVDGWREMDLEFTLPPTVDDIIVHKAIIDGVDVTAGYSFTAEGSTFNYDPTAKPINISGRNDGASGNYFEGLIDYIQLDNVTDGTQILSFQFNEAEGTSIAGGVGTLTNGGTWEAITD